MATIKLSEARVLCRVLLFKEICWPDGSTHIPAGAVGKAVLHWGGDRAGLLVEWDRGGIAGIRMADELVNWCRVPEPPCVGVVIVRGQNEVLTKLMGFN